MFVLRRILKDGVEINTCLGLDYVLVLKESSKDEFNRTIKLWSEDDTENVYGLVTFDEGSNIMPLYRGSNYYVMASDGKTFDNISEK